MAKKTDIGNKKFSKLLEQLPYKPNKNLINRLDSIMFPLDNNPIFNHKPEELAFTEFKRCLELFQQRNPGLNSEEAINRIAGVQKLIVQKEAPIKKQLQELCISTLKDIYQIPDYVDLKAFIQPRLSFEDDNESNPEAFIELTLEQKNRVREAIKIRECHVGLIHGSSMVAWKGIYHLISDELKKLNPELIELYDYYTSCIGICLWQVNPDLFSGAINQGEQITQGYSKVKSNRQQGFGATIEANAINFPVLIHECNKGIISYLCNAGIPQKYNEKELEYIYSIADNIDVEPWHYLLSPTLWSGLLESARMENKDIPKLISKLMKLNLEQTVELFHLIQDNKELATEKIRRWKLT